MDKLFQDEKSPLIERSILEEEIDTALKALYALNHEDPPTFFLIHKRIMEECSWKEIHALYTNKYDGEKISETALRKRFSRGRKKLRTIFHDMMPH